MHRRFFPFRKIDEHTTTTPSRFWLRLPPRFLIFTRSLFPREVLRDYKIRRRNDKDNARASHFFVHFFAAFVRLRHENADIYASAVRRLLPGWILRSLLFVHHERTELIPHEIMEFYSDELNSKLFDDYATYKMNQLNSSEELDSSNTFYTSFWNSELKCTYSLKNCFHFHFLWKKRKFIGRKFY